MPFVYSISKYFPGVQLNSPQANNFEANRFASYRDWNNSCVFASSLAKAGLEYTGIDDEVRCVWCPFVYRNWLPGQIPWDVHKFHSPECQLFTQTVKDGETFQPNICIPKSSKNAVPELLQAFSQKFDISVRGTQESNLQRTKDKSINPFQFPGVNMRGARHNPANRDQNVPKAVDGSSLYSAKLDEGEQEKMYPQFAFRELRLKTFKSFPLEDEPIRSLLCYYGFFYIGHSDIVICYCCGLGLFQWLLGDDPKISHARLSPRCRHLHTVVSSAFISAVRREIQNIGNAE